MKTRLIFSFALAFALAATAKPHRVALVVQNHTSDALTLPMQSFADTLAASLSGSALRIVNPHNAIGVSQNRTAVGEAMPEVSAVEIGRMTGAEGIVTASILEFTGEDIGVPAIAHVLKVRIVLNFADCATGSTVCGVMHVETSENFTAEKIKADTTTLYESIMHKAAENASRKLLAKIPDEDLPLVACLDVFFGCNVLGADVQIDGLSYGTLPAQLSLTPGIHRLEISYSPYYHKFERRVMFRQPGQTYSAILQLTQKGVDQRDLALEYEKKIIELKKQRIGLDMFKKETDDKYERMKLALEHDRQAAEDRRKEREDKFRHDSEMRRNELEKSRLELERLAKENEDECNTRKLALEKERQLVETEFKERGESFKLEYEAKLAELKKSQLELEIRKSQSEDELSTRKLALEKERQEIESWQKKSLLELERAKMENDDEYERKKLALERERRALEDEPKERDQRFKIECDEKLVELQKSHMELKRALLELEQVENENAERHEIRKLELEKERQAIGFEQQKMPLELERLKNENEDEYERKKLALERDRQALEAELKERSELFRLECEAKLEELNKTRQELERLRNEDKGEYEKRMLALEKERQSIENGQKKAQLALEKTRLQNEAEHEKSRLALDKERLDTMAELEERGELFKLGCEEKLAALKKSQQDLEIAKSEFADECEKKKLALEKERQAIEDEQKKTLLELERIKNENDEDIKRKKLELETAIRNTETEQKERCELFGKQLDLADAMLERYRLSGEAEDYIRKKIADGTAVYWQNSYGRIAVTDASADNVEFATPHVNGADLPPSPESHAEKLKDLLMKHPDMSQESKSSAN